MAETTSRHYARLSFDAGEVVVTPKDRDIFLISAEKATEACRDAVQTGLRVKRFESEILIPLHTWCVEHERSVQSCYIPIPGNHIQVFIVTASSRFDYSLAEEMAALELRLARSGWRIGVSQLPNDDDEALATFFSKDGALEVYAKRGPAPQQSGE